MKTCRRIWLRLLCQVLDHDVPEFQSFSCWCNRCGLGWHPNQYFAGRNNWTIRKAWRQVSLWDILGYFG